MNLIILINIALIIAIICNFCLTININREGFNYKACRKRFSRDFCITTPLASNIVGTCNCNNDKTGVLMSGFNKRCVCDIY